MLSFAVRLHTPLVRLLALSAVLGTALVVSACGGGGGGGDEPRVNPSSTASAYAGSWLTDCQPWNGASYRSRLDVTGINSTNFSVVWTDYDYTTTNCGGTPTTSPGPTIPVALQGTKTVDGKVVDKGIATPAGSTTFKDIFYTDGRTLLLSQDGGTLDEQGYPEHLDTTLVFRLQ